MQVIRFGIRAAGKFLIASFAMKFVLLSVFLCGVVLSMPQNVKPAKFDNCGAKAVKQFKLIATGNAKMDIACEMCLDLVLIAETYAECGEAEAEAALEKKCDADFSSPATDKMCRSMVRSIAHEVIEDTEQDPSKVCLKVIHKQCSYSSI